MRAFGRLSMRNIERLGIVHLYFRAGKLVHIVGNRGDALSILDDMQEWSRAFLRFDRAVTTSEVTVGDEYEKRLDDVLIHLHHSGPVTLPPPPRIIDSNIIEAYDARQLIAPWDWQVLVEGTRRVSLAVAHLVGLGKALTVLRDILDDCSSAFPAFANLQIAPSGYLQVVDRSYLDHRWSAPIINEVNPAVIIARFIRLLHRDSYHLSTEARGEELMISFLPSQIDPCHQAG